MSEVARCIGGAAFSCHSAFALFTGEIFGTDGKAANILVQRQKDARNGDIVVALVDDSATVKRFYKKHGKFILHPENDTMQDMIFDEVSILGIVKGLMRKF